MQEAFNVAYMVDTFSEFTRKIAYGVGDYIQRHGPWNIWWPHMLVSSYVDGQPQYDYSRVDAIISPARYAGLTQQLRNANKPTVIVASYDLAADFRAVMTDEPAIGKLAAEHFLSSGFRHFGYLDMISNSRLNGRRDGFISTIEKAGFEVSHIIVPTAKEMPGWPQKCEFLGNWLRKLPRPTAIMVRHDMLSRDLIAACNHWKIKVPEEISIMGVDDDLPMCLLSRPQLSSVEHNAQQIGYVAAQLLDQMLSGEQIAPGSTLIPPRTIVVRQSSDLMAVSDPTVAQAIRFIRDHASEAINVNDVMSAMAVSRSTLEKSFRTLLGRSIHQLIMEAHINLAKHYLSESDLSIENIATLCGFQYCSHLASAFKKATGVTCTAWRKKFQRK